MRSERVVLSAWVSSGGGSHAVGILVALAIIPLVAVVVNLVSGDSLPRELEGSTPWFVGATAVFAALAVVVYVRVRKRLEVVRVDEGLAIRVGGEELVRSPFSLAYGYERHKVAPRAPRTTILILGVIKDGKTVVSLTEEWGVIHGLPSGWSEGWPRLPPGSMPRSYRMVGMKKVVTDLVREAGSTIPG